MRDTHGRFQKHERILRNGAVKSSSGEVVNQSGIVEARIVAAQRKLETIFPFRSAVTGAAVATRFAQDRHNVLDEPDWTGAREPLDRDIEMRRDSFSLDLYRALAILERMDQSGFIDFHHVARRLQLCDRGQVNHAAIRLFFRNQDPTRLVRIGDHDGKGGNLQHRFRNRARRRCLRAHPRSRNPDHQTCYAQPS